MSAAIQSLPAHPRTQPGSQAASQSVSAEVSVVRCCYFAGKLLNLGTWELWTWELGNFGTLVGDQESRLSGDLSPLSPSESIFLFFSFSFFLFFSFSVSQFFSFVVLRLCEGCRTLSVDSSLFVVRCSFILHSSATVVRSFSHHHYFTFQMIPLTASTHDVDDLQTK